MYLALRHASARPSFFPFQHLLEALETEARRGAPVAKTTDATDDAAVEASPEAEAVLPLRTPRVDVSRDAEGYQVVAEVPGSPPNGVTLAAERGTLRLHAKTSQWQWQRTLGLPDDVDVDQIVATLEHGILTVRLPRVAASRPRQIRVEGVS